MIKRGDNSAEYPLIIIGGGPVGSALSIGLAQQGWHVVIVERAPQADKRWGYDERTLAINWGSTMLLKQLGVDMDASHAINTVRVTRDDAPVLFMHAEEVHKPVLGRTIIARDLGQAMDASIQQYAQIRLQLNTDFQALNMTNRGVEVLTSQGPVQGSFVFACDGAQSAVRNFIGLGSSTHDFNQIALLAKITHSNAHQGMAQECFVKEDVLALLPLEERRSSMVWVTETKHAESILGWSDERFLSATQQFFGDSLGTIEQISARAHYPMFHCLAHDYIYQSAALLGNAAHSLHPVAGQGLNIGFRDVSTLLGLFSQDSIYSSALQRWGRARVKDAKCAAGLTYAMVKGFSNPKLSKISQMGATTLGRFPVVKHGFMRYMMSG